MSSSCRRRPFEYAPRSSGSRALLGQKRTEDKVEAITLHLLRIFDLTASNRDERTLPMAMQLSDANELQNRSQLGGVPRQTGSGRGLYVNTP